ncbi:phage tail protein [Marinimicrobium alkaliphilum]|uniref:phage tail protein n=1 Tax=Marinimicrobium alkaliphilum TaxID=2202654 RepID=UPI001E46664F|nr:tail fiber protein [Marinimicrobium alkaliphilum]
MRIIELAFLPEQRHHGWGKAVLGSIQDHAASMNTCTGSPDRMKLRHKGALPKIKQGRRKRLDISRQSLRIDALEPFLGEIRMVGFNFAPRDWALCDGQLLSTSQNSVLLALLGITYGGDSQTTSALPDIRRRTPLGQGQLPTRAHHLDLAAENVNLAQPASSNNGNAEARGPNVVRAKVLKALNALNAYSTDTDTTLKPLTGSISGDTQAAGGGQHYSVLHYP